MASQSTCRQDLVSLRPLRRALILAGLLLGFISMDSNVQAAQGSTLLVVEACVETKARPQPKRMHQAAELKGFRQEALDHSVVEIFETPVNPRSLAQRISSHEAKAVSRLGNFGRIEKLRSPHLEVARARLIYDSVSRSVFGASLLKDAKRFVWNQGADGAKEVASGDEVTIGRNLFKQYIADPHTSLAVAQTEPLANDTLFSYTQRVWSRFHQLSPKEHSNGRSPSIARPAQAHAEFLAHLFPDEASMDVFLSSADAEAPGSFRAFKEKLKRDGGIDEASMRILFGEPSYESLIPLRPQAGAEAKWANSFSHSDEGEALLRLTINSRANDTAQNIELPDLLRRHFILMEEENVVRHPKYFSPERLQEAMSQLSTLDEEFSQRLPGYSVMNGSSDNGFSQRSRRMMSWITNTEIQSNDTLYSHFGRVFQRLRSHVNNHIDSAFRTDSSELAQLYFDPVNRPHAFQQFLEQARQASPRAHRRFTETVLEDGFVSIEALSQLYP